MTANPIPSDWFAQQRLALIFSGGPGIYKGADLIREFQAFESLQLDVALLPAVRQYIPKELISALGAHTVKSIDSDQPRSGFTDEIRSVLADADACLILHFDDRQFQKHQQQIDAAVQTQNLPVLTIIDDPALITGDTFLFEGNWHPVIHWVAGKLSKDQLWRGKNVLVTAGPTQEAIDPVRYITNHSSGKMGFAIARQAQLRGAEVTLITGPVHLETPIGVNRINVDTGEEMYSAASEYFEQADVFIAAAAVEDMKPVHFQQEKIKKQKHFTIECENTVDVLASLAKKKSHQFLVGFSVETENIITNSQKKLRSKSLDAIVVNNPKEKGAAFKGDTNKVTFLSKDGAVNELPLMSKDELAAKLLSVIHERLKDE